MIAIEVAGASVEVNDATRRLYEAQAQVKKVRDAINANIAAMEALTKELDELRMEERRAKDDLVRARNEFTAAVDKDVDAETAQAAQAEGG